MDDGDITQRIEELEEQANKYHEDLKYLERGILVEEFDNMKEKRKYDMEFRVL